MGHTRKAEEECEFDDFYSTQNKMSPNRLGLGGCSACATYQINDIFVYLLFVFI